MLPLVLLCVLSIASAATVSERQSTYSASKAACQQIEDKVTGRVFPGFSLSAIDDIHHYMTSSSQKPLCVVEVVTPEDVSTVLKIIGSTRSPFAIKSGGHASNPGFSSTTGVHISLAKMKQINLSQDKKTVEIGLGNLWSEVYSALDGSGVNAVGGRVNGPGTGGFTLGGGYSWLTNQYGLTCDTVESFNLVLPNGTITAVKPSNSDLFFALKGGLNRFGIVTSVVLKTVPQPSNVYGGVQFFGTDAIPALIKATQEFQDSSTDPKAQLILTINSGLTPGAILLSFYDGPNRPADFDPYNNIKPLISSLRTQSFLSFSKGTPSELAAGSRGAFATLSTTSLTKGFMDAIHNESTFYGKFALAHSGLLLSYDVEPFLPYGQYATDSAFPHGNSPLPLNLYFSWKSPGEDAFWRGVMQNSLNYLTEVAKREGIYSEKMYQYPNYALSTSTGDQLYGPENAARLRAIQKKYDPEGVMLLAGGFTI